MKVSSYRDVPAEPVTTEAARGVRVRWLIDQRDGAANFAMRHFEIEPGGYTPLHHHGHEHEVFVLEGRGTVREGEMEHAFQAGDVIYVAPDEVHQFRNTGEEPVRFLCMVPSQGCCGG